MKWVISMKICDWLWSPPSRGAWIEICETEADSSAKAVAPLAGGVD